MTWRSNRITGGSPDEEPTLVLSQKLQLPRWHVFYALFCCCFCATLREVAWAKVGYEGMSGIGLHDVKQGINKKKKKVEVTFSSPKYKNKFIAATSKVMS